MGQAGSASRDRFLDAALAVMRQRGIANTTTKLIAASAGLSEALLYKHFDDKQHLFLCVLEERSPRVRFDADASGSGDLREDLTALTQQLTTFYAGTFPMAASIFSSPELLARHREGIAGHGRGPEEPVTEVRKFLDAERDAGRIRNDADTMSAARALVGAAFHQGFLAAFVGDDDITQPREIAAGIVDMLMPGLSSD